MAKTIVIANQKGGIGKTTTATTMAYLLNKHKHKTLLIDADLSCNSSSVYRAATTAGNSTLYDVIVELRRPMNINDAIQHTDAGDIVAGDALLSEAEYKFKSMPGLDGFKRLKNAIADLDPSYEFVIIDTHPSIDMLCQNAMVAADYIVVPSSIDKFAADGLETIGNAISDAKNSLNQNLKFAGILLVNYDARDQLTKMCEGLFENFANNQGTKIFNSKIRKCVDVRKSQMSQLVLPEFDARSTATIDYECFVSEFLLDVKKDKKKENK